MNDAMRRDERWILATSPPPRRPLGEKLADLATTKQNQSVSLLDLLEDLPQLARVGTPTPLVSSLEDEWVRLMDISPGSQLPLHLVAAELMRLSSLHAPRGHQEKNDVPDSELQLQPSGRVRLKSLTPSEFAAKYKDITYKQPGQDEQRRMLADDPCPEIRFLLCVQKLRGAVEQNRQADIASALPLAFMFDVITEICTTLIHGLKHRLQVPRLALKAGSDTPVLKTPPYTSFPGGHAALAHCLATLLGEFIGGAAPSNLLSLAQAVSERRIKAGIHVSNDNEEGQRAGTRIGQWLIDLATDTDVNGRFTCPSWAAVSYKALRYLGP